MGGLHKRVENLKKFYETGSAPGNLIRYIPELAKLIYQGQISGTVEKKAYADDTYRDLKIARFNIQPSANQYMNFHNVHLVFCLRIKKKIDKANDIDDNEIPVNNFFTHWIKEIDIKCYGDILRLTNTVETYKYSDAKLKHVEDDVLEVLRYDLLYSKKKVILPHNADVRSHRTAAGGNNANRTDHNLNDRLDKFKNQIKTTRNYRVPLKYICNIRMVNQPIRFNTNWQLTFKTNMSRLSESKENQAAGVARPTTMDAKIILDSAPHLLYHQFNLDNNFRMYLEGALISENNLRTRLQKTPLQKSYEMAVGKCHVKDCHIQ